MTRKSVPLAAVALCLAAAAPGAWAVDYANVVSSTPVVAQVPVTQQQCVDQPVVYQTPNSGAGALLGAIAGAAIGNGLGSGAGRAAATGLGLVAGAAIGDRVETGGAAPVTSTVQRCRNVVRYENRTVGFDVVYDYQGTRRSARLAQDPGAQVAVEVAVTPVGAVAAGRVAQAPQVLQAPVYLTPGDVVAEATVPRVVYAPQVVANPAYVNPVYVSPVYVNPMPYVYIGGGYGAYGYGGWGGRGGYGGGGGHGWRR